MQHMFSCSTPLRYGIVAGQARGGLEVSLSNVVLRHVFNTQLCNEEGMTRRLLPPLPTWTVLITHPAGNEGLCGHEGRHAHGCFGAAYKTIGMSGKATLSTRAKHHCRPFTLERSYTTDAPCHTRRVGRGHVDDQVVRIARQLCCSYGIVPSRIAAGLSHMHDPVSTFAEQASKQWRPI